MKHAWTEHLSVADKGRARVEVASRNDDRGFQGGQRWPCFEFSTAEGSTGHVASMWLQSQSQLCPPSLPLLADHPCEVYVTTICLLATTESFSGIPM